MMRVHMIKAWANDIEKAQSALSWLKEHGHLFKNTMDSAGFTFSFKTGSASSCAGYKEAAELLGRKAENNIEKQIKDAIEDCENTIDFMRENIARESAPPEKAVEGVGELSTRSTGETP